VVEEEKIRETAKSYFDNVAPSHDWKHVERVEKLSERLAEAENADREIVKLAVLLHDIGRAKEDSGKIVNHAKWGSEEAEKILQERDLGEEIVKQVKHCIESHRYSKEPEPETLEAKILSDADNLDALGATGIARTFCVCGERKDIIANPETPPEKDDSAEGETSLNHLHKKILNLKDRMYTQTASEIAKERHQFVEKYIDRLEKEIQGEK